MNKIVKAISVLCVVFLLCSMLLGVSAASITNVELSKVSSAPVIDGALDAVYGQPKWDLSASSIQVGDNNLFPRTPEELEPYMEAYKVMNMKGYFVYDDSGIYLAVAAKDKAPRAAANSAHFCKSTNIQVVMYVNSALVFFTMAYTGTGKVDLINEPNRSELDISKIKSTDYTLSVKDAGNGNFDLFYELKIPYSAFYDVRGIEDIVDMRIGVIQTSMTYGYLCSAFGDAYDLKYDLLAPVTISKTAAPVVSTPVQSTDTTQSAQPDTDTGVDFGGVSSEDASSVESVTDSEPESKIESENSENEGTDLSAPKDDSKGILVPVLIGVIVVIAIGGVVAVLLLNKKK